MYIRSLLSRLWIYINSLSDRVTANSVSFKIEKSLSYTGTVIANNFALENNKPQDLLIFGYFSGDVLTPGKQTAGNENYQM